MSWTFLPKNGEAKNTEILSFKRIFEIKVLKHFLSSVREWIYILHFHSRQKRKTKLVCATKGHFDWEKVKKYNLEKLLRVKILGHVVVYFCPNFCKNMKVKTNIFVFEKFCTFWSSKLKIRCPLVGNSDLPIFFILKLKQSSLVTH